MVSMKKYGKKNSPRVQTTRLASFGTVFLVAAFHLFSSRVICRLETIYAIKQ